MKVVLRIKPLTRVLKWTERALFACAALFLGYCGFAVVDAWSFQRIESIDLDRMLADQRAVSHGVTAAAGGGLIGRIEIPRLGLSVVVVEGIGKTTLRRAVGHIPGTALPGQPGNVGISGHRDTFFRPLRNIQQNDVITLTTLLGEYRYRVVSIKVVGPSDVAVLDPSGNEILTLVTCYPFYFVGAAPERYIVRAERVV